MRLIDADNIKIVAIGKCKGHKYINADITDAPTIDAIPVEWLREKMQKPLITSANPFDYVLEAWEQDNSHSPTCGPDYCDID